MDRKCVGFWLQVAGGLLVLGGLGWTWLWWSPRKTARRIRDAWVRLRGAWLRLRGKSQRSETVSVSGSLTIRGNVAIEMTVRPADDCDDLARWVAYLEERIERTESQTAANRQQMAEGLDSVRRDLADGLADTRAHAERVAAEHREELTKTNLSGVGTAAIGGALTVVGLLIAGA